MGPRLPAALAALGCVAGAALCFVLLKATGLLALLAGALLGLLTLAAPFAAALALTVGFGEPRRARLAVALATAGAGFGLGAGLWMRDNSLLALGVVLYATVLAVPALAAGLLHHARHRKGGRWAVGVWARVAYSLALVASLAAIGTAGTWLVAHRWDLRRARRWVEAVAAEVRAEKDRNGRYPEDIRPLGERVGPQPRLVAARGARYEVVDGAFRIAFEDRPSSGISKRAWWVFEGTSGRWTRWYHGSPAPFEEWR